ncbi:MAG: helix-turn-helix transcriptional regulator [Ethanoligenens sp.]
MELGEKIRMARTNAHMTQQELAKAIGSSVRTVQFYEAGERKPKNAAAILRLAQGLGVKSDYFLSDDELNQMRAQDAFLDEAQKQFGARGRTQAKEILEQTSALFAGGDLNEDDQESFFEAITEIYFDAKKKARKYAPKRRRVK